MRGNIIVLIFIAFLLMLETPPIHAEDLSPNLSLIEQPPSALTAYSIQSIFFSYLLHITKARSFYYIIPVMNLIFFHS